MPIVVPLNNAHCMIAAAAILISTLIPLVAPGNDQVLREIQEDAIRVCTFCKYIMPFSHTIL